MKRRAASGGPTWLLFCLSAVAAFAQGYRPPEKYVQLRKPDQAEGKKVLEEFRTKLVIVGYYDFQLHILPRRGAEKVIDGKLWAGRKDGAQLLRIDFTGGTKERFLIQSGETPKLWRMKPGADQASPSLRPAEVDQPPPSLRLADTELTAFDLQMPFLYWKDFVYEGLAKVSGRPAHQFVLYPPSASAGPTADKSAPAADLKGVRIYLDAQFGALVQSELIGEGGKLLKTWAIVEFKRLGEVYIPKAIEVRNEATRDKARFAIIGAATGATFGDGVFLPSALAGEGPKVTGEVVKIE